MRLFSGYFFFFLQSSRYNNRQNHQRSRDIQKNSSHLSKNRTQFFSKNSVFSFINIISILHITESYIFCVDQGGRENLNFKFRFTFFCFVSYILSSFCFSLSELNWHHQKFALAKKIRLIFCFGSLLDKLLYKNGTKKCSRVVGRKKASTFFQLFFLFHLVTHGHIFSVKSRRPLNFYLYIYL